MAGNQQLARQRNDKIAIAPTQLRPQEESLLVELALAAENAKTEISEELQMEFVREFGEGWSAESLPLAFRRWHRKSSFIPSTMEIHEMLLEVAAERRLERENEIYQAGKADREAAQRWWEEHPEARAEISRQTKELEDRLWSLNRLGREPERSPRNVIALSQSKALRGLPPKKHPQPLPADAGAPLKQMRKAARP